jgi:hypothetical protein
MMMMMMMTMMMMMMMMMICRTTALVCTEVGFMISAPKCLNSAAIAENAFYVSTVHLCKPVAAFLRISILVLCKRQLISDGQRPTRILPSFLRPSHKTVYVIRTHARNLTDHIHRGTHFHAPNTTHMHFDSSSGNNHVSFIEFRLSTITDVAP